MVVGIREAPGHARYRREPAHPFPVAQTRRTVAGSRCHQVHRLSTVGLAVLSSTEQLTGMGEGRCRRNIDREDRSLDEAGPFASAAATLTTSARTRGQATGVAQVSLLDGYLTSQRDQGLWDV